MYAINLRKKICVVIQTRNKTVECRKKKKGRHALKTTDDVCNVIKLNIQVYNKEKKAKKEKEKKERKGKKKATPKNEVDTFFSSYIQSYVFLIILYFLHRFFKD